MQQHKWSQPKASRFLLAFRVLQSPNIVSTRKALLGPSSIFLNQLLPLTFLLYGLLLCTSIVVLQLATCNCEGGFLKF
ncbi:hypothetical protein QVD17_33847 [Tagetes erecta]|uniref:Uncharacterized protein n=1 Tax=Tagetes erecta TaxID=13708 RepID=A0AAD8JZX5_TARER|nr:hypothetical protein QVD17_33847 [Tagetes erecta]